MTANLEEGWVGGWFREGWVGVCREAWVERRVRGKLE